MSRILWLISILLLVFAYAKRPKPGLGSSGRIDGAGLSIFTSEDSIGLNNFSGPKDVAAISRQRATKSEILLSPFKSEPEGPKPNKTGVVPISVGEEEEDEETGYRRQLNVFLPDNRVTTVYNSYPARTVGYWGNGCTATLIDSRGIIVTNAHCMKFNADGSFSDDNWNIYFYAGLKNGNYLGRSKPMAIAYETHADYSVMKLWTNLAAVVGNMGAQFKPLSFFSSTRLLNMISYSGDHCITWEGCVSKLSTGMTKGTNSLGIRHNLDCKTGSDGATMYVNIDGLPYHHALNFAEYRNGAATSVTRASYSDNYANLAKPAEVWAPGWNAVKSL